MPQPNYDVDLQFWAIWAPQDSKDFFFMMNAYFWARIFCFQRQFFFQYFRKHCSVCTKTLGNINL